MVGNLQNPEKVFFLKKVFMKIEVTQKLLTDSTKNIKNPKNFFLTRETIYPFGRLPNIIIMKIIVFNQSSI